MQATGIRPPPPHLTDEEIDDMCEGLTQNAAKCRFLAMTLKVPVRRKPSGRPLVMRSDVEAVSIGRLRGDDAQNTARGPNVAGLAQWTKGRKRGA